MSPATALAFTLDFADGRCRYSHGNTLAAAIADAERACIATLTDVILLHRKEGQPGYSRVARIETRFHATLPAGEPTCTPRTTLL